MQFIEYFDRSSFCKVFYKEGLFKFYTLDSINFKISKAMKKKEVLRDYSFADSKLVTTAKEKVAFMRRDIQKFEAFRIDISDLEELETAVDDFSDTITDIEALGDQVESTELKDAKAEETRESIRKVMAHVALKFEDTSTKYRKFGTEALSHQNDSELLITAKRVYRMGIIYLPELEEHGLTQELLDGVLRVREELDDLLVDQKISIAERDSLQQERVEEGNAIFKTLMSYTTTGMSIWESSDVAKYNDYVIYNTISGEAPSELTL